MGAVLGKCMGAVDSGKVDMAIDKVFNALDLNKNGFIEASEARAAAEKVLGMLGPLGKKVTPENIDTAFSKVAGADNKISKDEFTGAVYGLVEKAGGPKRPAATGAAAAAPAGAAAAADARAPAAAATATA